MLGYGNYHTPIMIDILTYVPGRRRRSPSGWVTFNAICCHHLGHKPDKRRRGAVLTSGHTQVYKCFNCGFRCGITLGKPITYQMKQFFNWCGVDQSEINKIAIESLKYKTIFDSLEEEAVAAPKIEANNPDYAIPEGAELLDPSNPEHTRFIDYLESVRHIRHDSYPFMVTPGAERPRDRERIIIPFTYRNQVVGYSSRYIDDSNLPKYIGAHAPGYLFGYDLQANHWSTCIVVEGLFDALSVNGCALATSTISGVQFDTLRSLNRSIIVVPDRDESGIGLAEQALEMGFKVSIPPWGNKDDGTPIKDANDAVIKYGKLATILSIIQHATRSRITTTMAISRLGLSRLGLLKRP